MSWPIEQLEGRDHFVVPCVLIVEGVLNGSGGPIFYGANELKKSAPLWNGKPVVVYHPSQYGEFLAGAPSVFNQAKVGSLFNTSFEGRRLRAEAWIDVKRVQIVDKRVYAALMKSNPMEVSTGVFSGNNSIGGIFNGREYDKTAMDLVPDHLAILPDEEVACSLADGCGLARNQSYGGYDDAGLRELLGMR